MTRSLRRRALDALDGALRPIGLTIQPTWRLRVLPQILYLRRIISDWGISGIIDVGANAGQYRCFLRNEVGYKGPILSVEPIPELASSLKKASQVDSHWRIEPIALGASAGEAKLNIAESSEFSSIMIAKEEANRFFSGQSAARRTIEVPVDTLASLTQRHAEFLGSAVYLKLDTQGFDLEVLKGLPQEDETIVAAQTEASIEPIYAGAPSLSDTIAAFKEREFSISEFFPNNDGFYPHLVEFDCHFVKVKNAIRSFRQMSL